MTFKLRRVSCDRIEHPLAVNEVVTQYRGCRPVYDYTCNCETINDIISLVDVEDSNGIIILKDVGCYEVLIYDDYFE